MSAKFKYIKDFERWVAHKVSKKRKRDAIINQYIGRLFGVTNICWILINWLKVFIQILKIKVKDLCKQQEKQWHNTIDKNVPSNMKAL